MLGHAIQIMEKTEYRSFSLHNLENLLVPNFGRLRPEICKFFIHVVL